MESSSPSLFVPRLTITVSALTIRGFREPAYTHNVEFEVDIEAKLGGRYVYATVWETGVLGYSSSSDLLANIRNIVLEMADAFSLDYLRAKTETDAIFEQDARELGRHLEKLHKAREESKKNDQP